MKQKLDKLVEKYETKDFIKDDPIQFPHRFNNKEDAEISGFIASCLAYGKREKLIEAIEQIHNLIENEPKNFCEQFEFKKDKNLFKDFVYRFNKGDDIAILFDLLAKNIKEYGNIENIFMKGYEESHQNVKEAMSAFVNQFNSKLPNINCNLGGFNYLLPSPDKGSACKRFNLYLKWMSRKGPVDLNLWKDLPTSKLIIPLDTHVAKLSRSVNLTERKANDWRTAEEITENLKQFDCNDPTKYDFALFGLGINQQKF